MWKQELDLSEAACALERAGLSLRPEQLALERRDERWLVRLPGRRLAWFAATPEGEQSLAVERRTLDLLRARCSFQVPEVLFVDPLRRAGEQIGEILAEQHTRIGAQDVEDWLPRTVEWPAAPELVESQLEAIVPDRPDLVAAAREVLARYHALRVAARDLALIHTDLGFHNLAMGEDGISVTGVFDYGSAAWADRHHDFRILLYDLEHPGLLKVAMDTYESATGRELVRVGGGECPGHGAKPSLSLDSA